MAQVRATGLPSVNVERHNRDFFDAEELFGRRSISEAIGRAPDTHTRRDPKWTALFLQEDAFAKDLAFNLDDRKLKLEDIWINTQPPAASTPATSTRIR